MSKAGLWAMILGAFAGARMFEAPSAPTRGRVRVHKRDKQPVRVLMITPPATPPTTRNRKVRSDGKNHGVFHAPRHITRRKGR